MGHVYGLTFVGRTIMAVSSGPNIAAATDTVCVFATSGVFTPSFTGTIEILVVAGGGGGGSDMGGGGGAGGVISSRSVSVTANSPVTVTVGAGGTGAPAGQGGHATTKGTNGGNSVFGSNTAIGGTVLIIAAEAAAQVARVQTGIIHLTAAPAY